MTARPFIRLLASLMLIFSVGACYASSSAAETQPTSPLSPTSDVNVASTALLGWGVIERRVRRGVSRAVRSFRFGVADREDVVAISMEQAWRAFTTLQEPVRNPEGWGARIAERVSLDALRRQKRDRLRVAVPIDSDLVKPPDLLEHHARLPDPLEEAVEAERRLVLRRRVSRWPQPEQALALLMLDGHAETVTAAAWLYRAQEEARCGQGTMYPQKAWTLLEARRPELEDLV